VVSVPLDSGEPVDIRDETAALCRTVGLDPANVAELRWTPNELVATVYLLNDEGRKYVDLASNLAAMGVRRVRVIS
jgi:hypothetical protein